MKQGWEIKKLGEVCEVLFGTRVVHKRDGGSVYFVYGGGGATFKMDTYNRENCLVVARFAMSKQCTRFIKGKFFLNDSGLTIHPLRNNILQSFLNYQLLFLNDNIYALGKGAAQKNLDTNALKNISVKFPISLSEQERIVGILDRAFAKIEVMRANAEQNLQNAKDLFQASLKQELTPKQDWNKYLLKDVALDFSRGKSKHRPRNDKKLFGGEYPFIQTGEIRNANKYVVRYSVTYNEFGLSQSKLWNAGTVCITIAANIAETAILSFASCFPDSVIGVFPDTKKTSSDFLYYLLQYSKLKLQELGKGSAQDNINLGTFENMPFSFPSLHKQQSIVEKLDALSDRCRAMEENYRHTLAACNDLKQALLKKAFSGEL